MPGPFGAPLFVGQPPSAGGAPGTGDVIVATEAIASAVAGLIDGQGVLILSHRSWWRSDPSFAGALVAHVAIARAGGGALLRSPYADPSWRQGITDVYIDPSNVTGVADDQNKAIFVAPQVGAARAPLLTWQELFRRWGHRNVIATGDLVNLTFQIHVLSNEPPASAAQDPIDLDFVCSEDTFPRLLGEAPVVLLAGVLDAVGGFTAQNPAVPAPGGTAAQIKVGAQVWAAFLGKRIRRTTDGSVAYILKDLGAGSARISQPQLTNEALFFVTPTNVVWANGDPFVVENLATINAGQHWRIGFEGSALAFGGQMNIADVQILDVGPAQFPFAPAADDLLTIVSYQIVSARALSLSTSVLYNGCGCTGFLGNTSLDGKGHFWGGAAIIPATVNPVVSISGAGETIGFFGVLDFFTYVQGACVLARGVAVCGAFSMWDAPINATLNPGGHALLVGGGPNVDAGAGVLALRSANPIFGTGSTGKGCRVASGSKISAYLALPNITGATGDLQLADSGLGQWGDFATGTYQPPGGLALTWAALTAAAGPGGFGGSAHNIAQDAHVNKAAAT